MTYAEKLKDPRWQRKRLKILERDDWTCLLCQDTKETLHVHHQSYNGNPWDVKDDYLFTYCCVCHSIVENFSETPVDVIKVFKSHNNGEDTMCAVVLKDKDADTYSIFFLVYYKQTNTTDPRICFSPVIIRKLNEYLDFVKSQNPSDGQ